jgi:hypothetical protein
MPPEHGDAQCTPLAMHEADGVRAWPRPASVELSAVDVAGSEALVVETVSARPSQELAVWHSDLNYLSMRMQIDPISIPKFARERILEHLLQRGIWLILCFRHLDRNIGRCSSPRGVKAWAIILVLCHGCVCRVMSVQSSVVGHGRLRDSL